MTVLMMAAWLAVRDSVFRAIKDSAEVLPFWAHVVIGSMLLVAFVPFVDPAEIWTSDEGAVRAQVEFIASDGSWSRTRPFADIDPEMVLSPIMAATINGDDYYPYTKRPALPTVLAPLRSVLGQSTLIGLSLAGTVAAAIAGAVVVGIIGSGLRRTTFWAIAFASPLLVYGYTVMAYTLAAACAAFTFVVAVRPNMHLANRVLLAMSLVGIAISIRIEAAAFGLSLAIVLVALWWSDRERSHLVIAAGLVLATAVAHVANTLWAIRIAGVAPVSEGEAILDGGRLVRGAFSSLLLIGFQAPLANVLAVTLVAGGGVLLALAVRHGPERRGLHRVLAGVCAVGVVALAFVPPLAITGFFVATPVVAVGLVLVGRNEIAESVARSILLLSLVLTLAVIATQDSAGGGIQWGGRYLMLVVPLLVPVAIVAIHGQLARLRQSGSLLIAVVVFTSIAFSLYGLALLRRQHAAAVGFQTAIVAFAEDVADTSGTPPVLVSTNTHLGRHAWRTIEDIDYLLVPEADFDDYMRRLAGEDLSRFGLILVRMDDERELLLESVGFRRVSGYEPPYAVFERVDG